MAVSINSVVLIVKTNDKENMALSMIFCPQFMV